MRDVVSLRSVISIAAVKAIVEVASIVVTVAEPTVARVVAVRWPEPSGGPPNSTTVIPNL